MKKLLQNLELRQDAFNTIISCFLDSDGVTNPSESLFDSALLATSGDNWLELVNRTLQKYGWNLYHRFKKHGGDTSNYYIVGGRDPRNDKYYHYCIYKGGMLYHDPHPSNSGILTEEFFYDLEQITIEADINLDDYSSHSSTVSKLQGDMADGKQAMLLLVGKYSQSEKRVKELEEELAKAKQMSAYIKGGIDNISRHLELEYPLTLVNGVFAYNITSESISKIKNVF
jgi:hypothetical protein